MTRSIPLFIRSIWLFIAFFGSFSAAPTLAAVKTSPFETIIAQHAAVNDLSPYFVRAVIWRESGFNRDALGAEGEIGLMQIRHTVVQDWAREHELEKTPPASRLFDPEFNIMIGCWRLRRALDYWEGYNGHTMSLALCEYNAGRNGMMRHVGLDNANGLVITNPRLNAYVDSIINRYEEYAANRVTSVN